MRDGTHLACDLYFPPGCTDPQHGRARFPTLLLRTPYDRKAPERTEVGRFLARAEYVVAIEDCRGRFDSEGEFGFLQAHEAEDGYDTVEWLAAQPWSDGQVATFGTSYSASLQSALATLNPPHLRAMWVHEGLASGLEESVRQGGAFELRWIAWALYAAASNPRLDPAARELLARQDIRHWLRPGWCPRPGETPLDLDPACETWLWELYSQGHGPLWERRGLNVSRYWEEHADVPTVYSGGWYDSYSRATIKNFAGLSARKIHPQYLLMGPWIHGWREVEMSFAGNVEFGEQATIDFRRELREWFDTVLKGAKPAAPRPPVRFFLMGGGSGARTPDGRLFHGGRWISSQRWPVPQAEPLRWYLTPQGGLEPKPSLASGVVRWRFDPHHPVPTVGGNISSLVYIAPVPPNLNQVPLFWRLCPVVPTGGQDQRSAEGLFGATPPYGPLADRPDVVSFSSARLPHPAVLCGPVRVNLWVSSSAYDTDFTAKLIDWYPPSREWPHGYALNLSDGILRLRYRDGFDEPRPYTPRSLVRITIELFPVANLFQPGHRIRLDISSSNYPRFDVNPNTGDPLGGHRSMVEAVNQIAFASDRTNVLEVLGWWENG
jgi:putative CocE/NonD family hydrolase